MTAPLSPSRFVFPKWTNYVLPVVLVAAAMGAPYQILLVGYGLSPVTLNSGYQPSQPIPYSHELHVSQLGIDCRYCHNTVETAAFAAIPSADTCMKCHHAVRKNSPKLQPLHDAFDSGEPVKWVQVHDLPDYSYFDHSAHVNKGVSCVSCHGRIDRIGEEGVFQQEPLNMGWCLKCHRDPAPNLRPVDEVTNLAWGAELSDDQRRAEGMKQAIAVLGKDLKDPAQFAQLHAQMQDCSKCHR